MNMLLKYRYRILVLIVLTIVLGAATYGFAAGNSVPPGVAGEGQGAIGFYTVTNVKYELNASNPNLFSWVHFDLDQPATAVHAGIDDGATIDWVTCAVGAGVWDFDCDLSSVTNTVTSATALHVASAE